MADSRASTGLVPSILLSNLSEGRADTDALFFEQGTWSFLDLALRASAIADLSRESLRTHQTFGVLGANHPDWVAAYYGVAASGRVLCFLNHRLAPLEIIEQMNRAKVMVLLVSQNLLEIIQPFLERLVEQPRIILFDSPLDSSATPESLSVDQSPDDPAWLLFTSGTTGKPKGVLLSHRNIFASLRSAQDARRVGPRDVYIYPFPTCHVAGYNIPRLHQSGRPVVLLAHYDPENFISNVERFRANSGTVAATMLASLLLHLEQHPEDLRRLATFQELSYGAAPMPTSLLLQARQLMGLRFSQGFGMSELAGNALFLDTDDHERGFRDDPSLLAAAGSPGPGVRVKIVNPDELEVPAGISGEILIKGDQVMIGYLDDPEGSEKAIVHGWLHTGDIGVRREDGVIAIVDRLKDVIVTGGENVASLEVEQTIRDLCPEIIDIAVVGVPDPKWGENVCACVVFRPHEELTLDQITLRVTHSLARYKIPRHLVILEALPQTHSGKAAKAQLRTWLFENPQVAGQRR